MFDETLVKNRIWRNELNRILLEPNATNGERLFLCCFCRDKLNWQEVRVINFIHNYNHWLKYDRVETTRHVNLVFERRASGVLVRRSHSSHSQSRVLSETQHKRNTPGEIVKNETRLTADTTTDFFSSGVFDVSPNDREQTWKELRIEEEEPKMEETKVFGKINDHNKFYRVVEKTGEYGAFTSIDSGPLLDAVTETGETVLAYGRPNKFFTLPKEPETLMKLIGLLQATLPQPEVKVEHKKK